MPCPPPPARTGAGLTDDTAGPGPSQLTPKPVLQKARRLLDAFDAYTPSLGITELSRRSGVPKTTCFRLAQELVACEMLDRDGSRYRLGAWLFELGQRVPEHRRLRVAAAPFLEEISRDTHETAALSIPGHDEILFSEKYVGSQGRGQVVTQVDGRVPLHCGASGKVVLAFGPPERVERMCERGLEARTPFTITDPERLRDQLEGVRSQGFAVERQELVVGYGAVAAPVWVRSEVVATMTVVAPVSRLDVSRFSVSVLRAASALTSATGGNAMFR